MVLGELGEAETGQKHPPEMTDLKNTEGSEEDLPKWFVPVWHELRKAFLIGAFTAGLVVAGMNWYRETFPAKEPATADQLNVQGQALQNQMVAMQGVVRMALQNYTDSLSMVRDDVERTMANPILENIIELNRKMRLLGKGQQNTSDAVEQQRTNAEATTRELLERINAIPNDNNERLLRRVLEKLDEQDKAIEELKTGKKISKFKG